VVIWYIFPRFGIFYQKNLATLLRHAGVYESYFVIFSPSEHIPIQIKLVVGFDGI
jgi:hypothetical protein